MAHTGVMKFTLFYFIHPFPMLNNSNCEAQGKGRANGRVRKIRSLKGHLYSVIFLRNLGSVLVNQVFLGIVYYIFSSFMNDI